MKKVRVIKAGGATLAGPMKLKLTKDQHTRRAHILGPYAKNGLYDLDGGQALAFKEGEELGVDKLSKVSKAAFEEVGKGPVTDPGGGTGKGAISTSTDAAGKAKADADAEAKAKEEAEAKTKADAEAKAKEEATAKKEAGK